MKEKWEKVEEELLIFCSELLYKLSDFEELEDLCWISSGDGDGMIYCHDCCEKEVDKINKELVAKGEIIVDEDGEILHNEGAFVDGGWGSMEEDGCGFCYSCGVRLATSLTKYGVESEVDHFIEYFSDYDDKGINNSQMIDLHSIFEHRLPVAGSPTWPATAADYKSVAVKRICHPYL